MTAALMYLQATSIRNALRQRLQRLRQPRYLFGAAAAAAYFYFFFFRHLTYRGGAPSGPAADSAATGLFFGVLVLLLMMLGRLVYAWVFSADRAALAFTPAEVEFLFPAPLTRRTLVHFKLLKSQLRILFSAVLLGLLSNRFTLIGGNAWTHAAGWWIVFSTIELHGIGASFTRERLLHLGLNPARRRLVFGGALLLVAILLWWAVQRIVPAPTAADAAGLPAFVHYVLRTVLAVPLVSWVSAPFRWVLGPFFAPDTAEFLKALGPALLILAAHYVWVIRADVAFEEASIDLARKRAERLDAIRSGGWRAPRPSRRRADPFRLRPSGPAPVAFLWKNFISAGPWFYPRNWLLVAAAVLAAVLTLAALPAYRPWLQIISVAALPVGLWLLLFIPMLTRRQVHLLIERLDVIKSRPLHGWQVVLGEMLGPIVLIAAVEWLALAVEAVAAGTLVRGSARFAWLAGLGSVEIGLLIPPVAGLMIAIPFAATLCFPAWMASVNQPRGMETMGQRLIFSGGFLLALVLALLPAALAGAGPGLGVQVLTGSWAAALAAGALTAAVVLAAELVLVVWWLGRRYDRFDLSHELPSA